MPVYKIYEEMTYEELLGWFSYLEQRPIEWRADDRAAKLIQVQGVKEKPWQLFTSLDAIYNPKSNREKEEDEFDPNSFKRSGFFQQLAKASGGENLFGLK
jgi:hypothetical protein